MLQFVDLFLCKYVAAAAADDDDDDGGGGGDAVSDAVRERKRDEHWDADIVGQRRQQARLSSRLSLNISVTNQLHVSVFKFIIANEPVYCWDLPVSSLLQGVRAGGRGQFYPHISAWHHRPQKAMESRDQRILFLMKKLTKWLKNTLVTKFKLDCIDDVIISYSCRVSVISDKNVSHNDSALLTTNSITI